MFFVLCILENNDGVKGRLYDMVHPPQVTGEKISIDGIFPYYKITAKMYRGIIPWNTIETVSGKLKSRAVLPAGVTIPQNCGLAKFVPKVLPERVLFNSAVDMLRKMALDPTRVFVSVVDENGYLTDLVEDLVSLACGIRVVTGCSAAYEKVAERLMAAYGLSLVVSARVDESILTSTVIISARSAAVPMIFRGLLFTNERRRMMNATVLTGEGFQLPKKYAAYLPENVDELTFASALYELCSADELGKLKFQEMKTR